MKPLLLSAAIALMAISTASAQTPGKSVPGPIVQGDMYFEVEFREGQPPVTIHARTFDNRRPIAGQTVLAVHGFAHNAFSYEPLATTMINGWGTRHVVDQVIAVSLPGHGASTIPMGDVQFGQLQVTDYVTTVRNVIDALNADDVYPSVIVGHSLGGLTVMMLQQQLLDEGTSLHDAFGIDTAILIAPVAPEPVESPPIDPSVAEPFIASSMLRGTYVSAIPEFLVQFMFSDLTGQIVPSTPGLGELCSLFSVESMSAFGDVVNPPYVDPGILADDHGTETALLGFSQDWLYPVPVTMETYAYLTGEDPEAPDSTYTLVEDPDAVHDTYISQPQELMPGIRKVLSWWWWK
jgi:pimeloyl-ACP methyl ester carboxylesterase